MSLSDVTISHDAWGDPRVQFLAQLAKYADGIDTAVAKMARLWARCTFLGTDVVSAVEVNACLGSAQGAQLLLAAGLGEETADGIRVKGRFANDSGKDRLGWFAGAEHRNANGGKARAAKAIRGPNGAFLPRNPAGPSAGPATPAGDQRNRQQPASNSSDAGPAAPAGDQDQRSGSGSGSRRTPSVGSGFSAGSEPSGSGVRADHDPPPPAAPPPGMELELPAGWEPEHEPDLASEATRLGVDLVAELAKLRDRARARGERRADWQAAWRSWVRRSLEWAAQRKPPKSSLLAIDPAERARRDTAHSAAIAAANRANAEREREERESADQRAAEDREAVRRQLDEAMAMLRPTARAGGDS